MRANGWLVGLRRLAGRRGDRPDQIALGFSPRALVPRRAVGFAVAVAVLALVVAGGLSFTPARARGEEAGGVAEAFGPTAAQTMALLESGKAENLVEESETDLHAAQTMPHRELDRGEALELAEAVFEPELEGVGGIYDQLEPERFLSNYAAVAPVSSLPEGPGQTEEGLASEHPNTPVLVESMLPLRTEGASGEEGAVDLELERSEGELQPRNPLTEIGIPDELGEGISLSASEVELTIAGAPEERTATDAGGEFAFYPEVAEDTDLIVAPTAQGVETMTDIRSAAAPMQTTYDLALPAGAELRATEEGGAEVVEGGHTTLLIPAPAATDAAGNPVQTGLTVSGETITVAVTPNPSTALPILVDPTFIEEGWRWTLNHDSLAAWTGSTSNGTVVQTYPYEFWASQYPGLDISSGLGGYTYNGAEANWRYWVPRYREDLSRYGETPTTWLYRMFTEGVLFLPYGSTANYPALVMGLINTTYGWNVSGVHYGGQGEMNDWGNQFTFTNEHEQIGDKGADMELFTPEAEVPAKRRDTYMADAYMAVVDTDAPELLELNSPEHWMNGTPGTIPYEVQDKGLGIRYGHVGWNGVDQAGWGLDTGCAGTVPNPCPRIATSAQWQLNYNPMSLPTGKDMLTVTLGDPLWGLGVAGHTASSNVLVKVDHAAPELQLSGSLTEQASIGTRRPAYALRVNAKDGVEGAPQSGIKKVEIRVDGKAIALPEPAEWEPNCQTQNCAFDGEWTMNASEYAAGTHEAQVVATDAVGNVTTRTLQVELHPPPPTLAVSGTLTEQAALGTERPSYKLKINASALAESPPPAAIPTYSSSFGTSGAGNGQFSRPGSMTISPLGNLIVADSGNNRVESFGPSGEYGVQLGTKGSGNGQLSRPTAVAVDANDDYWVTDSGNKRVEEFNPGTGAYLGKFGSAGTGNGQFAGSGPEAIAIDYHGNIWVADTYGGRLEKFNENGVFIRSVATKGKGPGQLGQPDGIAIAPGGNVFVTDWEDDKVVEYGEGGAFIRQFGSEGNEPGQLENPTGIAIDSRGDVWVADQNNGRIEEFNQGGEYLGRFGAKGKGAGQFELSYPTGIATDANGDIWVTDTGDSRIEKWVSAGYANPTGTTYVRNIGSHGSGAGQLGDPTDVTVDAKGNIWVTDLANHRIEKFNEKGEYQSEFGSAGSGAGQFVEPLLTAVDPAGHLWVLDRGGDRVEEFGETGTFIRAFGTLGTGSGNLSYPSGIAVDSKGHVWVADRRNNRVEEFSETGAFIRTFGSKGSGSGQMIEPMGLTTTSEGDVWVTDPTNDRIEEFTETGGFVRSVGSAGTGIGHFTEPTDVKVDAAGDLWVVEDAGRRVQELTQNGEFLSVFGSAGTGPGQFEYPLSLAFAHNGHILVAESGNFVVSEWSRPASHSRVSTEITVDGKRVEAGEKSCEAETCNTTSEWTLQSSSLTPGSHEVVVRATDGLGNTTSKTLNIKVGDSTKPNLEVGGELAAAPEGWIEQAEGNYGLHASATDSGYGVTSLVSSIDGKPVASKTQTCVAGGCSAGISTTVNAHDLAAGAHQAEVIATDGAGNVATKKWTVNVDPDGAVTTEELAATAEALEETSGSPILAATDEIPGIEGSTSGVGLTEKPEEPGALRATGTYVPMEVGKTPEEGFEVYPDGLTELAVACDEVEEPEDECVPRADLEAAAAREEEEVALGLKHPGTMPITVTPIVTGGSAEEVALMNGQSAVSANAAGAEADTFTRPMSDGGLSFADIRGPSAPEHYAYEMNLSPELHLRQPDPQHIEVFYWEYGITAFVITAEPAHDAIGTTVPTHLSISGPATITLTVEHRGQSPAGGGFVYPVMGGTGWQGGYRTISVELTEPLPPAESEEEDEELEEEGVSVETSGEYIHVDIMGFGPQHVAYSSGGGNPTPNQGWAAYIGRECDWQSGEFSGATGKSSGPPREILDELIYHCHKHPNLQSGTARSRFAVSVNGTYAWTYGKEARIRTKPGMQGCRTGPAGRGGLWRVCWGSEHWRRQPQGVRL
jgi:tripartite motif-containing protein 71